MKSDELIFLNYKKIFNLNIGKRTGNYENFEEKKLIFSDLILNQCSLLVSNVIELHEKNQRNGVKWLQSCLITRFLFESVANFSILKNTNDQDLTNERWRKWLYLRDLQIYENNTYGISLNNLPEKTLKRIKKNKADTYRSYHNRDKNDKKNLQEYIKLENEHFSFDDPWGLTMFQKMQYIDLSDSSVFLSRWRMYSQIAHASSFSFWPMWIDPVPVTDAVQCISILFKTAYKELNIEFDTNNFTDSLFDLIFNSNS